MLNANNSSLVHHITVYNYKHVNACETRRRLSSRKSPTRTLDFCSQGLISKISKALLNYRKQISMLCCSEIGETISVHGYTRGD